ncbi:MAG: 6-aminohexanoate hydrolase [Gammaproteobacteria bacterium]|nr:MAG: 6-aminohexanoate hydrolase [Gammaproteobacteria bacterium]
MRGFPPPPEKRPGPSNWDLAPFNRWSFLNMRSLFPTADVKADCGNIQSLSVAEQDLHSIQFTDLKGDKTTVSEFIDNTYTDGFMVLHGNRVITENYYNAMLANTPHLSQSVAKSIVGSLVGVLCDQGILDIEAPLIEYVPELANCGYKDANLGHALTMTSGVQFVEDYNAPHSDMTRIDIACGWRPPPEGDEPPTIRDVILSLPKIRGHGEIFNYRSVETDVVAWVIERATAKSLSELVSELIWQKIGAEHDAFFTVDKAATVVASGGFNATLRDYARFGLMMQNDGLVGDTRVVSKHWVERCASGNNSLYGKPYTDTCPDGAYSNFWWVDNIAKGDFMARGVFGQMIYINREAELTIVKLSTWPDYMKPDFTRNSLLAFDAIRRELDT